MEVVLTKTAKGKKYLYEVKEVETGKVLTSRTSERNYVAATVNGCFYFGRLDLIGKGDSKKAIDNGLQVAYLVGYLNK